MWVFFFFQDNAGVHSSQERLVLGFQSAHDFTPSQRPAEAPSQLPRLAWVMFSSTPILRAILPGHNGNSVLEEKGLNVMLLQLK